MAAGDSSTSIANLALAMVGEEPIVNVDPPDANKRARWCAQFYDTSRRAMLAAHPWRAAKRQTQLAAAALMPAFTYGAAYPVPDDYIRAFELPEDGDAHWEEMNLDGIGVCIVTDTGSTGGVLDFTYIFDLIDVTQMDPLLVKAIAADMAVWLAWPLARDASLVDRCTAERDRYLSLARTISAQQGSPREFDADVLLRSRW